MIHEFAVDPEALANWKDFRYLVDNCGVSKGRLISRFPSKWKKMVYSAIGRCSEMEKKRLVEGLTRIDAKLLAASRDYDGTQEWIPNALISHATKPFRAIITTAERSGQSGLLNIEELSDEIDAWVVPRGAAVFRTASAMAAAAETLLECSSQIVLVDQHFSGNARFGKPLNAFLQCACTGSPVKRFEYHLGAKSISAEFFRGDLDRQRAHLRIPEGIQLVFLRWRQLEEGDTLHARYILTERGGFRFDYGLDEGKDGETTDVECLDDAIYSLRWNQYHPESGLFDLVDAWIVTAGRVGEARWEGGAFVEI